MPAPYDLTNLTAANDAYQVTTAANQISHSSLSLVFLIGAFFIFFFAFKRWEVKIAVGGASFLTAIAAIFLRILNWIPDTWMFATFLIAGLALIWIRFD